MRLCLSRIVFLCTLSRAMAMGIVGGKEAKPHSRPYMASLQKNGEHKCGGFLIRDDYVLTAAHCLGVLGSGDRNHLEVVLGAHDLKKKETSQQKIKVQKYYMHQNYAKFTKAGNWKNVTVDIMLLKLQKKAKLNKLVKVLELPKKMGKTNPGTMCTISGWGMRQPESVASSVLYETKLKILPQDKCKTMWQQYYDSDHMMCTLSQKNNAFCQGDSGGPLMCNNKPQGLAIYTYPKECNNSEYPGVYINVSAYLDWIKKHMRKNI